MISITIQNFATDLLSTVDLVLNGFVQSGYEHLIQNNQTELTLIMTFYVAWLGYKFLNHTLEMDVNTLARHLGALIIVYALVSDWQLYYMFFYNLFTNEPGVICQTMIDSYGNINMGGETTAQALDSVFNQGMSASTELFSQANYHNIPAYFEGIIVYVATALECLVAIGFLVYAKMAMAIALFLGPIFIIFFLFNPTREFFNKWLQKLFNYALIPIITCGILMLTMSIANTVLPGLYQNVSQGNPSFSGALIYLGLGFISLLLYTQISPMSAALSAGMALAGLSLAIPLMKSALSKGGSAAGAIGQGLSHAKGKISGALQDRRASRAQAARDAKFGSGSGKYY